MGASDFVTYAACSDVETASRDTVEDAQDEYGSRGGTGSIAENHDYLIIAANPLPREQAESLARDLLRNDDPRFADKWGPAGALAVRGAARTGTNLPILGQADGYPDDKAAAVAALGQLAPGERFDRVLGGCYSMTPTGRVRGGEISVRTVGAAEHIGWLLFGLANR